MQKEKEFCQNEQGLKNMVIQREKHNGTYAMIKIHCTSCGIFISFYTNHTFPKYYDCNNQLFARVNTSLIRPAEILNELALVEIKLTLKLGGL